MTPPHQFVENLDRRCLSLTNKVNDLGAAVFSCPSNLSSGLGTVGHQEGTTEAPDSDAGGLGRSPKAAQRKPAPFEIPVAWLVCASVAANARSGYPGHRAIEVEVVPAGKCHVAYAVIREGSRHIARLVGDFASTELEALHSLEPLFVRFAGSNPEKTP